MPKLSKTQQAQRRAHLLDAAEVCFARAGFHRTTMQDICREAGVSAGAIYVYFASKEALIDGIVERDREEITRELAEVADAEDILMGLETLLQRTVLARPPHKAALYVEMLAEANRNPQVAAAVGGCETGLFVALTDMLRQAQGAGRISPVIDPEETARLLLVMGDGIFVMLGRRGREAVIRVVPHLLAMIGQFLAAPASMPGAAEAAAQRAAAVLDPVE